MSRLTNPDLRTWLNTLVPNKYLQGPGIPDVAGQYVLVTGLSGPGFDAEQAIDRPGFQLRVAGPTLRPDVAETLAFALDSAIVNTPYPTNIGNTRVILISRSGGVPAALETDAEDRTVYVCSYIIHHAA